MHENIDEDIYEMSKIHEYIEKSCKEKGHKHCRVAYSAYEEDKNRIPINNLDKIAIYARVELKIDEYYSDIITNPTWLDICLFTNEVLCKTHDSHIFVEGYIVSKIHVDGTITCEIDLGS